MIFYSMLKCNIKDVRCCMEMVLMFINLSYSVDLLIFYP